MNKFSETLRSLQIGDRLIVPKSSLDWVQHHAIFIGFKNGHYWFIENKDAIGVRVVKAEVLLASVTKITKVTKFYPKNGYSRSQLVNYALSKKGKAYHLTNYNCEHFANQVQYRVVKSKQADTGLGIALLSLAALVIGGLGSSKK